MTTAEKNIANWRKAIRSYQSRDRKHKRIFGTPLGTVKSAPKRQKPLTSKESKAIAQLRRFLASSEAIEAQKFMRLTDSPNVDIASEFSDGSNRFDHLLFTERGLELTTPVGDHGSVRFVHIEPREAILRFRDGIWKCQPKEVVKFILEELNAYADICAETDQDDGQRRDWRNQIVYSGLAIEDD